jgi:hypothetical protein
MSALEVVVLIAAAIGVVLAIATLATNRKNWAEYGKGRLTMEQDAADRAPTGSALALRERDDEIRQLLEARNRLRQRRGGDTVDVDEELARLTAPELDAAVREEIRELVIARNHRRARRGEPPLDVEAEVQATAARLRSL